MMRWLDAIIDSVDEFERTLQDIEGQRNLTCCSQWGCKESDTTEQLNKSQNYGIFAPNLRLLLGSFLVLESG